MILFHAYTGTPADVRMLAQFYIVMIMQSMFQYFSGHGTPDVEDILGNSPEAWYEDAKRASTLFEEKDFTRLLLSDYRWAVLWRQN